MDTGQKVWTHPYPTSPTWGSMLATAGGLVFTGGTNDRKIRAFDAASGKLLWEFVTTSGIVAPPSTFAVNGKQYLAVHSGWGGDPRGMNNGPQSPLPRSVSGSAGRGRGLGLRAAVGHSLLRQKVQRRRLRAFLDHAQPRCRQLRSPSVRKRGPAKVAVRVQERQRDLRPDIGVDDHQQKLPVGPKHARHFRQRPFDAFTIEMIDRRHAHDTVEGGILEGHLAHVTDLDLESAVNSGDARVRAYPIRRVVHDAVVAGEAIERDDVRARPGQQDHQRRSPGARTGIEHAAGA